MRRDERVTLNVYDVHNKLYETAVMRACHAREYAMRVMKLGSWDIARQPDGTEIEVYRPAYRIDRIELISFLPQDENTKEEQTP